MNSRRIMRFLSQAGPTLSQSYRNTVPRGRYVAAVKISR
jgi:hypothetical protein